MRKLIIILLLLLVQVVACQPKIDPAEPTDGRVAVVQVWFTVHCKYCRTQVEILQSIENRMASSGIDEKVEIVYIDPFDTPEEIVAFLQENDYSFEVATTPLPTISRGVPIIVISVAGQDEPVLEVVGVVSEADLLRVLYSILEQMR